MPSPDLPKLDHGIPPPETYLPGTPVWFWWLLAVGSALCLVLLFWLFRLLKPKAKPARPLERDLFTPAMTSLHELEEAADGQQVSEIAARISLTLRTYLADARSEPALYETVEEFQARQTILPPEINRFLNELNEVKYAKSKIDAERAQTLVAHARECLKTLHTSPPPKPAAPPPLKARPDRRRQFAKSLIVVVPLGLIGAIVSFLLSIYDGSDTGSDLDINPITWIALGVSALSLLAHLFARPQP